MDIKGFTQIVHQGQAGGRAALSHSRRACSSHLDHRVASSSPGRLHVGPGAGALTQPRGNWKTWQRRRGNWFLEVPRRVGVGALGSGSASKLGTDSMSPMGVCLGLSGCRGDLITSSTSRLPWGGRQRWGPPGEARAPKREAQES